MFDASCMIALAKTRRRKVFYAFICNKNEIFLMKTDVLALIAAASPDLEKQGFLAVVFVIGNIADEQETASKKKRHETKCPTAFKSFVSMCYS